MTAYKLNGQDSENEEIIFETLLTDTEIHIPPKLCKTKVYLQFGLKITNNTIHPHHFLLFFARPEFFLQNMLPVLRFGPNVNGTYNPLFSDFRLIMPGESETLMLEGYFQWESQELKFVFTEKNGSTWIFSNFCSGTYLFQLTYENPYSMWNSESINCPNYFQAIWDERSYQPRKNAIAIENVWIGEVSTPKIELHLI